MHWRTILLDLFGPGTWGAGGNIAAAPVLAVIGAVVTFAFWRPLKAFWKRHHPHSADLAEIRQIAEKAHRIAADTYEHHTGRRHPDAPAEKGNGDE